MNALNVVLHFFLITVYTVHGVDLKFEQSSQDSSAFSLAMDDIFVLDSGSNFPSNHELCKKNIMDLFMRQNLPLNSTHVKALDLRSLYKYLILSSVAGITNWKRDDQNRIKLTDYGYPIQVSNPSNTETDIMTCIICSLLIVISTFHLFHQNHS